MLKKLSLQITQLKSKCTRILMLSLTLVLLATQFTFAAELSQEQIKEIVRQTLHDNPDMVLDVLRENSEVVLEIAQQGNLQRKRRAMIAQWLQDIKEPKNINTAGMPLRGNASAPVTIVAFSDFTCSFCQQAESTINAMRQKYSKEVRLVFMPLPNEGSPISILAAKYAMAAFMQDQQKGWAFYDELFAQAEALEINGDNLLKQLAEKHKLDIKKLMAEVNGNTVSTQIAAARKQADLLGIQGTPFFFVNDLVVRGAVPKEFFEEAIQMALKKLDS